MFVLSAVAVDKEIVGSERDGELICAVGELWCTTASNAADAFCGSFFDLLEGVKYCTNLLPLDERVRGTPTLSLDIGDVVGALLFVKGMENRRGMLKVVFKTRCKVNGV